MSLICERHFILTILTSCCFFILLFWLSVKLTWYSGSKEVKVIKYGNNKIVIEYSICTGSGHFLDRHVGCDNNNNKIPVQLQAIRPETYSMVSDLKYKLKVKACSNYLMLPSSHIHKHFFFLAFHKHKLCKSFKFHPLIIFSRFLKKKIFFCFHTYISFNFCNTFTIYT